MDRTLVNIFKLVLSLPLTGFFLEIVVNIGLDIFVFHEMDKISRFIYYILSIVLFVTVLCILRW